MDQPGSHILLRGNQPGAADRMRALLARASPGGHALRLVDEHLTGSLEPVTGELRSRPGHAEIQDAVAKIVDAGQ